MPDSKGAHLTYEDRCDIVAMLAEGRPIRAIARRVRVHPSTISREIARNRTPRGYTGRGKYENNHCTYRGRCGVVGICGDANCTKSCSPCKVVRCNERCPRFIEEVCNRIVNAPHCCNGCSKKGQCRFKRYDYIAKDAHDRARTRLVQTRSGIDATPEQVEAAVKLVREQCKKGQALAHIWTEHADEIYCSERTFYRHQAAGLFEMTALEFPRKARYKTRKLARTVLREQTDFTGRTYKDYLALSEAERAAVVQMDTVEGKRSNRQVILTLHFVYLHFQIYIRLAEKTQAHVAAALDWVESLCEGRFSDLFGLILTDRGLEMIGYDELEHSADGSKRCSVYYCDPQQSAQKGAAEKNHVELRRILPKRRSDFDALTPYAVAEIMSHINSYTRPSLGGACPYDLASQVLPTDLLEGLGVRKVAADDVNLTPSLLDL